MKITYTPNPLNTIIELDDHDKEIFRLKIKINLLEEDLGSAAVYLDPQNASWVMNPSPRHPEGRTLEALVKEVLNDYLDMSYMYSEGKYEGKGLDARVNDLTEYYIGELQSSHCGDCTCVAMSCCKCHAESILGLDTMKGLGKHSAYKIQAEFSNGRDDDDKWRPEKSIDEVLASLKHYKVTPPADLEGWKKVGGWEQYVPRWESEAKAAYEWLLAYRNEHFGAQ